MSHTTGFGDTNVRNFELLIETYESAIQDITTDLDEFQIERNNFRKQLAEVLQENTQLSKELVKVHREKEKPQIENKYSETDIGDNLQGQLSAALIEKESVTKLWQNAVQTIDHLEGELRVFQDHTQGFIPRSHLSKVRSSHEVKVQNLEEVLAQTQRRLDVISNALKRKEENEANQIRIVKGLEEEILKVQKRLSDIFDQKTELEETNKIKSQEIESLNKMNSDCRRQVEEAVAVVEAALNEKDAALLREQDTKEELLKLSQTLSEVVSETSEKVRKEVESVKATYEAKLQDMQRDLQSRQDELRIKVLEVQGQTKECACLQKEIARMQMGHLHMDDSSTSRLLILEKNLENTFQKLLISEKANIQLKSEKEIIRNDLEQMSQYYERDVQSREVEKIVLKKDIKRLEIELEETRSKLKQSFEKIAELNSKIESVQTQMEETTQFLDDVCQRKIDEIEKLHNCTIEELQEQLVSQIEINKRWRSETKIIIEKLEKRISELKLEISKFKMENKALAEKLREAHAKVAEYRELLQLISLDVSKITTSTLPDPDKDKVEKGPSQEVTLG